MKKITKVGVMSVALTAAGVYAIVGLLYGLLYFVFLMVFGAAISAASGSAAGAGMMGVAGIAMVVILPIFFAVMGFIVTGIMALIYNLIAKYTGGISYESA
jgi:TRAP-type C4-dicarboxylate transport system permease small subunit